jgi:hypothetical protein
MSHNYLMEETKKLQSNGYLAEIQQHQSPSLDGSWTAPNILSASSFVGRVMVVFDPVIPELISWGVRAARENLVEDGEKRYN